MDEVSSNGVAESTGLVFAPLVGSKGGEVEMERGSLDGLAQLKRKNRKVTNRGETSDNRERT